MSVKYLGKISNVRFGKGGYDDAMFGLTVQFSFDGSGCVDFKGTWRDYPKSGAQYSEESWRETMCETLFKVKEIMDAAKVDDLYQLKGIAVEVEFDRPNGRLVGWRVLTEVL